MLSSVGTVHQGDVGCLGKGLFVDIEGRRLPLTVFCAATISALSRTSIKQTKMTDRGGLEPLEEDTVEVVVRPVIYSRFR